MVLHGAKYTSLGIQSGKMYHWRSDIPAYGHDLVLDAPVVQEPEAIKALLSSVLTTSSIVSVCKRSNMYSCNH